MSARRVSMCFDGTKGCPFFSWSYQPGRPDALPHAACGAEPSGGYLMWSVDQGVRVSPPARCPLRTAPVTVELDASDARAPG